MENGDIAGPLAARPLNSPGTVQGERSLRLEGWFVMVERISLEGRSFLWSRGGTVEEREEGGIIGEGRAQTVIRGMSVARGGGMISRNPVCSLASESLAFDHLEEERGFFFFCIE